MLCYCGIFQSAICLVCVHPLVVNSTLCSLPVTDKHSMCTVACLCRDEIFVIPELPAGRDLVINIRSTWGDRHYVGLTGLEVFQEDGRPVEIAKVCVGVCNRCCFAASMCMCACMCASICVNVHTSMHVLGEGGGGGLCL